MINKIGVVLVVIGIVAICVGILFIAPKGYLVKIPTISVIGGFMTTILGLFIIRQ